MEITTEFICFTSAVGGSGCTSSAITMARLLSMLYEKKVLIISFDCLSCKMCPNELVKNTSGRLLTHLVDEAKLYEPVLSSCISEDDFGVSYISDKYFYNPLSIIDRDVAIKLLSSIASCCNYDYVIIDLPFKDVLAQAIAICCEKIVIVNSFLSKENRPNEAIKSYFNNCIEYPDKQPEIVDFSPLEDRESFADNTLDIHGQFGAEVRALASELFD